MLNQSRADLGISKGSQVQGLGIREYQLSGIDDERSNCDSISELEGLKDGLVELQKDFDLSLAKSIKDVESDIAELEERSYDNETYNLWGRDRGEGFSLNFH